MKVPRPLAKLGTLALWPTVLALGVATGLAAASSGCMDDHDDCDDEGWGYAHCDEHMHDYGGDGSTTPPAPPADPMVVAIDRGATIQSTPGEGVGLFVEYAAGGTWHVWTTCDTGVSGYLCTFDVIATPEAGSTLTLAGTEELEGVDAVLADTDGSLRIAVETDYDADGVELQTTPGALLRLDVYLDGQPQPRFVYWMGDGILHEGAPSNPVDFAPTGP